MSQPPTTLTEELFRIGEGLALHRRGSGRLHEGVDLFARVGTAVRALVGGVVLRVVNGLLGGPKGQRAGWYVDLLGNDGFVWRYLHLDPKVVVHEGQDIAALQRIGSVGVSGIHNAKPHFHLEKRAGDRVDGHYGKALNPLPGFDFANHKDVTMDWKGILDKVLTIGGPIAAKAVDYEYPGAGGFVVAGTSALDDYVVKPYVPGDEPSPEAQPKVASTPPPSQTITSEQGAELVRAALAQAGWRDDQRDAIMRGSVPAKGDTNAVRPAVAKMMAPGEAKTDVGLYSDAVLGNSKDSQRAYDYLLSRGWQPREAQQTVSKSAQQLPQGPPATDKSDALWAQYVANKKSLMQRGEEDES